MLTTERVPDLVRDEREEPGAVVLDVDIGAVYESTQMLQSIPRIYFMVERFN